MLMFRLSHTLFFQCGGLSGRPIRRHNQPQEGQVSSRSV